jgi:hypothetical protein
MMKWNKPIRLEELLPEFQRLAPAVQVFLVRYLSNGHDKSEACQVSHPKCASPAVLGCQILSRLRVRRILDLYEQRSAVESMLLKVERLIKHAERDGVRMKSLILPLTRVAKALERLAASELKHESTT